MLQYVFISIMILLQSGCALLNSEQYTKNTTEAVKKSEQSIITKIDTLDARVDGQSKTMDGLVIQVSKLIDEVSSLKSNQIESLSTKNSALAPSMSTEVSSNIVVDDLEPQIRTGMITLGSLETVYIDLVKSTFIARVDTGAATSSINAVDMQKFERNGRRWVKFHVSDDDTPAEDRKWVEAPIIRHVKIRQASMDDLERRPVVELWVKIGNVHEKAQFTLTDRTQMDYPLLLGREFIQDVAFVDVSRDYIESNPPKKKPTQ